MKLPVLVALTFLTSSVFAAATRRVDARLVVTAENIPAGTARIRVWVPLPRSSPAQAIQDLSIKSPYRWSRHSEDEYGNEYLFAEIVTPREGMELLTLRFKATRREVSLASLGPGSATERELQRNLRADRLVTLSPRIRRLADEITRGKSGRVAQARAIYHYVLATMRYDKTRPGWGRGDTERACDIRTGNCTDFHSLFMSLARAKGIPARFVIGFLIPGEKGQTTSYHCWAEFYLPERGWVPVDPSEASKSSDGAVRDYLFGNLDPNRIEFTIGRDLNLTPPTSEPLNFFIYPRLEINGVEAGHSIVKLSFEETEPGTARRHAGSK